MDHEAAAIREELRALGRRGRTEAFPSVLRERVAAYALARRPGVSWGRLGECLTLSPSTVHRWCGQAAQASSPGEAGAALVPVVVTPEEPVRSDLALVSPRGFRVEGLSLDDVVRLLDPLS